MTKAAGFSTALATEVAGAFGAPPPAGGASRTLAHNLKIILSPDYLAASTAEKYALQTAVWAGARMDQGVWYQMTAPLLLPGLGLGQFFTVTHNIAFSYARALPCTPQDASPACAEIVIHATPLADDMAKAHVEMSSLFHMPDFEALHYWSSIDMRLVVRPETLEPVLSDMRKSWYVAVAGAPRSDSVISSERVVTTYH